jgi:glycerate kinase
MRFLIAPDKFKGSLSATDAADRIAAGILAAIPNAQIDLCPIADGGEGTVAAILKARSGQGGRLITRRVTGPLPEMKVDASFALLSDNTTAVIEMSAASGLALLQAEDRNPLNTTTFGTGELIATAVNEGAKKIIVGLGGSATVDAGIGMAQACGYTILTNDGEPTSPTEPLCGRDLSKVLMVKHGRGEITNGIEILALADVTNPLFGPTGAPRTFGPQKGATPEIVEQLDAELESLSIRTGKQTEAAYPGAGAAGGLGFGILAFLRGSLVNGFDCIAETVHLRDRLKGVDLCFTAEGRLDSQTAHGKAVIGVARLCKAQQVPCVALVGSIGEDVESLAAEGLIAYFSICNGPMLLDHAVQNAGPLLQTAAHNCAKLWKAAHDRQ